MKVVKKENLATFTIENHVYDWPEINIINFDLAKSTYVFPDMAFDQVLTLHETQKVVRSEYDDKGR